MTGASSMPVGPVVSRGRTWTPVKSEDFDTPVPVGGFRDSEYRDTFSLYPEGSGGGKYRGDRTVSVSGGSMRIDNHRIGDVDAGAAGQFIIAESGAWAFTGGRFAIRFRADPNAAGYGTAIQLWPTSEVWGEGEMDFPEGDFGGSINLYHHEVGEHPERNLLVREGLGSWADWHTAVTEWIPGVSVHYYLDGELVGEVTDPAQVPSTDHNFVLQTGPHDGSADGAPDGARGTLEIDWVVVYR